MQAGKSYKLLLCFIDEPEPWKTRPAANHLHGGKQWRRQKFFYSEGLQLNLAGQLQSKPWPGR
jgi:hypothetical protein